MPASTTTKPASGSNVTVQSVPEEHTVLVYMLAGGSPMCADLRNVPHALLRHATDDPGGIAFRTLDGETWTWRDYLERAARFAGGLRRLGVAPGDRVVLMLRNRLEFHVADVGALLAGATPISIYNSSSPDQISYLAGHCGAVLAVTEEGEFADRMLAGALEVPGIRSVVVVGDVPSGATAYDDVASGEPVDVEAAVAAVEPTDLLTVIYTSGTTGPPKGVMLDHTNVLAAYKGLVHFMPDIDPREQRVVSYLPMAHIAERNVSHYNHLLWGGQVTPCADIGDLGKYLVAVRPTLLFGPPRVFEKLVAGIQSAVAARPVEDQQRFADALAVGRQVQQLRARGEQLPPDLATTWEFVDEVAFRPLRAVVGLDECRVAFSGAAP
ncbi:MAG TPA: AMP-binding protein, partial [Mycobacteriales bacterium]|nr:AMP-binding protein [Mycobacteriales bacterium]